MASSFLPSEKRPQSVLSRPFRLRDAIAWRALIQVELTASLHFHAVYGLMLLLTRNSKR